VHAAYLGEFEAEFKNALARESGDQGVENLVTLSRYCPPPRGVPEVIKEGAERDEAGDQFHPPPHCTVSGHVSGAGIGRGGAWHAGSHHTGMKLVPSLVSTPCL
jgi:hypothetical protein